MSEANIPAKHRELSAYAFATYGNDAKLYNGIHDLETMVAKLMDARGTEEDWDTRL